MKYIAAICAGECDDIEDGECDLAENYNDPCFHWPRGCSIVFEASTSKEAWAIANKRLLEGKEWGYCKEELVKSGEWFEEMSDCYTIYIDEIGWGTETSGSYKKLK